MAQTSATLTFFFFLIPILLLLVLSVGAIIYRAACTFAGKVVGIGKQVSIPQEHIQNVQAPSTVVESNPFSAPGSFQTPELQRRGDLCPSFGIAMLIVFLTGAGGIVASYIIEMTAARTLSFADFSRAQLFLRLFGFVIQFSLMTIFGKLILNTTWRRATLVTTFYFLLALAIGVLISGIVLSLYWLTRS